MAQNQGLSKTRLNTLAKFIKIKTNTTNQGHWERRDAGLLRSQPD